MEGEWKWWDRVLNYLIHTDPQAFLNFFFGKGQLRFLRHVSQRLDGDKAIVDELLETEVIVNRELLLVHVEAETRSNAKMGRRLQKYNGDIRDRYEEVPAISCGLHLRDDTRLKNELVWRTPLPGWEEIMTFRHPTKELQDCTPEELRSYGHPVLLTLIPLTQGGAEWEVVDAMLHDLEQVGDEELLKIAFGMADQCMSPENRQRLKKEYDVIYNKVLDDPLYNDLAHGWEERGLQRGREEGLQQGIQQGLQQGVQLGIQQGLQQGVQLGIQQGMQQGIQQGVQQGIQQGVQQGIQQGLVEGAQQLVIALVDERFPGLGQPAQKIITAINDPKRLQPLVMSIATLQNKEEVLQFLNTLSKENSA